MLTTDDALQSVSTPCAHAAIPDTASRVYVVVATHKAFKSNLKVVQIMRSTDPFVAFLLVLVVALLPACYLTGLPGRRGLPASSPDRSAAPLPAHSWELLARSSVITSLFCSRWAAAS